MAQLALPEAISLFGDYKRCRFIDFESASFQPVSFNLKDSPTTILVHEREFALNFVLDCFFHFMSLRIPFHWSTDSLGKSAIFFIHETFGIQEHLTRYLKVQSGTFLTLLLFWVFSFLPPTQIIAGRLICIICWA